MAGSRQPINLVVAKGKKNLTKKEIEERMKAEVQAERDKVQPPAYLTKKLKDEFTEIANELLRINIMTNLDNDALARFVMAQDLYIKITKALLKEKPIVKNPTTGEEGLNGKHIELTKTQDKLFKQVRAAASDLGLTISSRCKLVLPKADKKEDPTPEQQRFGGRV
ncbi:phage terminase small subunit P27 family [Aureibacillus halotolerans]|uniref:P27 family predicted phage terminase small subunit n=1 Tax=Aureibacillus halotolerans TaxID=1508390 RepID=A0A4V6PWH0_9BACI|nr:phage terminase small subunit P27 family [Aureibacillus halotolerans]TDQ39227.1 P27 family predicted phage terminase small subunit [Aureibacillus halotolerans]